ncbi:MAG: ATP-binding protein [Acidimicrobiia bacterium]|nr:ATP-binding protein [Acidimicrobiia bacterium]
MLDRLLHRSVVFNITGDSYRLRAQQVGNRILTQQGGDTWTHTHPQGGESR